MNEIPENAPERVMLHVAKDGLTMFDRGVDTTPVVYVRSDIALRPRVRPVEAEEHEDPALPAHEGW